MYLLALLHPAVTVGAGFSVHPSTAIGIAVLAALYEWRARHAKPADGPPPTSAQRLVLYSALAILFFTLNGPLHDLSDTYLFSAHMVQHLVLTLVIPPMLIGATPGWMLRPLLRARATRAIAERALSPVGCYLIFNVVLAAWHLPPLYNLALANHDVHIGQHLLFIAASVVMWWPLLSPLPELPRLSYPGQMLYCFLMTIPMSIIAIYITMSERVLYPLYAIAPRIWGMTPMQDQHYGGLVMWIPGGLFFYGVMTVVFVRWATTGQGSDTRAAAQVA